MLNRSIKYILFFVVLILGDLLIGNILSILSKKQKYDKRIELLLRDKIHSDIIIIGSSEALNDYSPEAIQKNTGLSCYNLGVSGSNPVFHETMLDLVLMSSQKPKLVIYNIDDYAALYSKGGIIYRTDVLYPYVDHPFINKKICGELKKNEIATLLSSTYKQNVNFVNSIKYLLSGQEKMDYRMNNINAFGATLIDSKPQDPAAVYSNRHTVLSEMKINESYKQALLNIQEKCLKNNIKLMFCFPPQYANHTVGFFEMVKAHTNSNVTLVNFEGTLADPRYYFDPEHLNRSGANHFSELLSAEIKKIMF